jgi:deazaflavin-dependent oxidoreductase (nitroreductase family)
MPSDAFLKAMNVFHKSLLRLTGGRIGTSGFGMPVLELTTTGRKSGKARSVMLTSPYQEGDSIVIVGSRGGDPIDPAWVHNIRANPEVKVAWKGAEPRPMKARVATSEERARIWPQITSKYKNYGDYQTKTTREIPLVFLDPA